MHLRMEGLCPPLSIHPRATVSQHPAAVRPAESLSAWSSSRTQEWQRRRGLMSLEAAHRVYNGSPPPVVVIVAVALHFAMAMILDGSRAERFSPLIMFMSALTGPIFVAMKRLRPTGERAGREEWVQSGAQQGAICRDAGLVATGCLIELTLGIWSVVSTLREDMSVVSDRWDQDECAGELAAARGLRGLVPLSRWDCAGGGAGIAVSLAGLTSLGFATVASLVLAATQMRSAQLQASRSAEILAAARHGRRAWAPYSRLGRRGADHTPGASARAPTLWDAQRVQRVVAGLRLLGHSLLLVGKALLLLWLRTLRPQQIMLHLVSKRRQEAFLVALRQRLRETLSLGAISVARLAALMLGSPSPTTRPLQRAR